MAHMKKIIKISGQQTIVPIIKDDRRILGVKEGDVVYIVTLDEFQELVKAFGFAKTMQEKQDKIDSNLDAATIEQY